MGFKPSTPAPAQADPPATVPKTNGTPAPAAKVPATTTPAARNVAAEIADLAKARDDGRSLSDGGAVPAQGITMEGLLRMSDAEFADYVDTLPAGKLDEIMGRQHV
jgi:hypothetical protein